MVMKHLLAVLFVYEMLLHVGQGMFCIDIIIIMIIIGNQYYIAAMRNLYGMTNNYFLHITTMSQHTVVFHIDGYTEHITDGYVSRGSPATISLDIDLVATDNTQRHKGIHIYTNDSDINVLVINDLSEFGSTGDYIAIPYKVYSTEEYIYYAVSSSSKFSFLQSLVLLVGTEDNTSITITPTVSIAVPQDPQDIGSSQITIAPGTEYTIILHRLQTLMLGSSNYADITGTKIVSNKPVTVISGHECGTIPANRGFCEHLTVQIPPTITWGQTFILNPHTSISESHIYQIIVSEPNTSVTRCYSDNQTIVDNTSMQFSFNSTNCFMNSSNPVLVIEFGLGSQMGNPVISIVPPVAQYTTNIVFYTPNVVRDGHFINIATTQRDVMLLNGRIMDVTWSPVFNGASNAVGYTAVISNILPNTDYTVATMNNHSLSVMVYGFDFDTSYSYNVVSGVVKGQAPMIRECPDGMYSSDGTCVNCQTEQDNPSCQIGMLLLRINHSIIIIIIHNFYVVQDEAPMIRECPDGMYLSGGTCVNCQTEQDNPSCQIGMLLLRINHSIILFIIFM